MAAQSDTSALQERREELLARLSALGDLRPGSLVQSYRRCGKANCFCTDKQHRGHGPYSLLTRKVAGKTRTRSIPASQVAATQAQVSECQRLRRLVAELIEVSDELCQSRLTKGTSAARRLMSGQPHTPHA
ncbi:MAG: hypothetical protein OXN89_10245 [Bryobacterales bacterium]|nr:hypothetical protein [Bryobacterales bacterium]